MATIAQTIANQIGNRAFFMMGAKNLLDEVNALSFRIGRNAKSVNYIKVTLNGMDTYDLEFGRIHGLNYTVKATFDGAYADMLKSIIEENTGMYLSL